MLPGQILVSQGTNNPFVLHRAITVTVPDNDTLHVLHHTSERGPLCEPVSDYLKEGREVLWTETTKTKNELLLQRHERYAGMAYDALTFNCEHYISALTEGTPRSPQITYWKIAGALLLCAFFAALLYKLKSR